MYRVLLVSRCKDTENFWFSQESVQNNSFCLTIYREKRNNMKKTIRLNESQVKRVVAESVRRVLKEVKINENDDFTFGDSHMTNPSTHRQVIKYKGKEIGYLLYKEHGGRMSWLSPVDEIWVLPDVDYGMDIPQ
jgi:hypothetical protein